MRPNRSESRAVRAGLAVIASVAICLLAARPAAAVVNTDAAIEAIQHYICFATFWWDIDDIRLGKTVSITLRKVGDIAYAWSTDLSKVQHVRRSADFFTVFTNGGKTVVGYSYGSNLDLGVTPALEQNKAKALGPGAETVQLHVPADCTPHFAADTPLKEQMLKTVAVSMANELAFFNKNGAHYPRNLRVAIANFNEDYPETQVFIPSTGEVYHVALQNSTDPLSETSLRRESYQVQQEYRKDETEILRKKILRYAIVRDITLDGG